MKKQISIIVSLLILLLIILGGYWIWQTNQSKPNRDQNTQQNIEQNTNQNQEPEVITSDVDTSDWLTYRNEELGFEFKYPNMFVNAIDYNIWSANNNEINLLYQWGINKEQETIFSISVYPNKIEQELISSGKLNILNKKVDLFDGEEIVFLSRKSYLFRQNNFIYVVTSSFSDEYYNGLEENKQFYSILSTLLLFIK